jgi:hypothetical protein
MYHIATNVIRALNSKRRMLWYVVLPIGLTAMPSSSSPARVIERKVEDAISHVPGQALQSLGLLGTDRCPLPIPGAIAPEQFGAKGDGKTDDSAALQRALDAIPEHGQLRLSVGKVYLKRTVLHMRRPNTSLIGQGATIYSLVTQEEAIIKGQAGVAIELQAQNTHVCGAVLSSNIRRRVPGHPHASGIWLSSSGHEDKWNRMEYLGIFARKAVDFEIEDNVVVRSPSDGIHITNGSVRGSVRRNIVQQTGDDLIGVVSYAGGRPAEDIEIAENKVSANYWGRGIAVVGGQNIRITKNTITDIPYAAGILVNTEVNWNTASVSDVTVSNNTITRVQVGPPIYNPRGPSRRAPHGAIDIHGQGMRLVSTVRVVGNHIGQTTTPGVMIRGDVDAIELTNNRFQDVAQPIVRQTAGGVSCQGNMASSGSVDTQCNVR